MDNIEVVVLCFIPVRQVPEDADVLKAEVVPLVVIWIVGDFVIMDVLTLEPASGDSDQLPTVNLVWSASLISVCSRDPATVEDDSRAFKSYWVFSQIKEIIHRHFTTLITVERVNDIEAWYTLFSSRDKDFLAVIKLAN